MLTKHYLRRTPAPAQERELGASDGLEKGRRLYTFSGGSDDRYAARVNDDGTADIYCRGCKIAYLPHDYEERVWTAHRRGEDLILLRGDMRRDTR